MCTATIRQWGNSQGIIIPRSVLQIADLNVKDTVEITVENQCISLRKAKAPKSLAALFEGYSGDYRPSDFETGEAVGAEVYE